MKDKGKKEIEKKNVVLKALTIEYVPVTDIKPNAYNPNRQSEHEFDLLLKSMSEDGFTQPIVVLRSTKEIVDGEHRWRAASKLGFEKIPVVFVDMTPEQMRIATLRHNRARGTEDIQLTASVLRDLQQLGALEWAQDSLDLDDVEINRLLDDIPVKDALAADQFSDSWTPTPNAMGTNVSTDKQSISMTPQAIEVKREAEKKMAQAKTEEEKQMVAKTMDVFNLSLVFAGDEAKIVKKALGNNPAPIILEFCNERVKEAQ